MFVKKITFTDFDGNVRTEDHYFNLMQSEIMDMEMGINGGLSNLLNRLLAKQDMASIKDIYKQLIMKSYGIKSLDGRRFEKSEAISKEFTETPAYDVLYMELLSDKEKAVEFLSGIMPKDVSDKVDLKAELAKYEAGV